MAQAYPESTVHRLGLPRRVDRGARKRAAEAGLADRVSFEVATAQTFAGGPYDLVTTFDCLHDMGDPVGAARHVRQRLAPDGTWMIVEPLAGDTVADNLNPVGRVYYSFSTFLCVPNALSQDGGYSLGAQAGEARDPPAGHRRRLQPVPPGGRDPVQPRVRGPALSAVRDATGEPERAGSPVADQPASRLTEDAEPEHADEPGQQAVDGERDQRPGPEVPGQEQHREQ